MTMETARITWRNAVLFHDIKTILGVMVIAALVLG